MDNQAIFNIIQELCVININLKGIIWLVGDSDNIIIIKFAEC